jgi:cell division protein FtsI (penicillin-binding protein 3)
MGWISRQNFLLPDRLMKARITFLMLVCILLSLAMLMRAAHVQVLKNPRLEWMARRQFQSRTLVRPHRGLILDRHADPLAVNVNVKSLAANPKKIKNKRNLAVLLARAIGIGEAKLFQKLSENREFVWMKRHLSAKQLQEFKKLRIMDAEGDLVEGLWLVKESERVYPHGRVASHLLGDVNIDSEGLEGVELWMNERLRGKVVSLSAIKDALGRPTFIDARAARSIQDGETISLTIDAFLQYEVEQILASWVKKTGSRFGSVIVMHALTGEIFAMANEPSFDARSKSVPLDHRRNRAMTDGYEPGSTLKAMLLVGMLMHGGKLKDRVWAERGSFVVQGHTITEAESHEKFEWLDLTSMIRVSSNIAAAKFAFRLGADLYFKTLRLFGLGAKTQMGFPGEISGRIPPRKNWTALTLANIGFGQGILVTPLQMVRAYAALANGGWLIQPHLIRASGERIFGQQIFSAEVSQTALKSLVSVTQEGTGEKARLPGYQVAGKTGTAQMVDPSTGKYSHSQYITSFIGFALNDPLMVIFVSLGEPQGSYYASVTAAPFFREVLQSVVNRCGIPMSEQEEVRVGRQEHFFTSSWVQQTSLRPASGKGWIIPSFEGLTPREVFEVLKGYPLQLELYGSGLVRKQEPAAGKVLEEGVLRLWLHAPSSEVN